MSVTNVQGLGMFLTNTHLAAVSLREAIIADAEKLEALVHQAYRSGKASVDWKNEDYLVQGPRITAAELRSTIASADAAILLSEVITNRTAAPVGCVLIEKHGSEAHIGLLSVSPQCQNSGLGRSLINAAENHARRNFNCSTAKMFVLSGRSELLNWYKRLGYTETGETAPFPGPETGLTALQENPHFVVISKRL